MTPRRRPANRRAHETIAIEHEGQRYKIGLGRELVCIGREQLTRPDDVDRFTKSPVVKCSAGVMN